MNSPQDERVGRILDRLASSSSDPKTENLIAELRRELDQIGKASAEQAEQLAKFAEAYEKLTAPANRIGLMLGLRPDDEALVALGDGEFVVRVDPKLEGRESLVPGSRVLLNEAYAVVGFLPPHPGGATMKVSSVLEGGRIRVGGDQPGSATRILFLSEALEAAEIKAGDEVRVEPSGRMAVEVFPAAETREYFVEDVPETPWSAIGGQEEAIKLIRDTIELPLLHPEIYEAFDKKPVKGILLYGPPGCGKTLIGKAVAYNLAKEYSERAGREVKECFLSISGPKILNMWLGETERMVREIFETARRKAKEGNLVVLFIDEAESILRTRSSGRWLNISNTVVPQFCAEMDGIVGLENVVIVLTSNRPDYIDPAILRPERIDRKVKIRRPDRESAKRILSLYLHDRLPLDPSLLAEFEGEAACGRTALIEEAIKHLWRAESSTEFLKVFLQNGSQETLYYRDLVSGALLKSIVDRAKDFAIQRAVADKGTPHGIAREDVRNAIDAEYAENEIFPKSDVMEDWLKLIDLEAENVANVRPIRPEKAPRLGGRQVI